MRHAVRAVHNLTIACFAKLIVRICMSVMHNLTREARVGAIVRFCILGLPC